MPSVALAAECMTAHPLGGPGGDKGHGTHSQGVCGPREPQEAALLQILNVNKPAKRRLGVEGPSQYSWERRRSPCAD